MSAILGTSPRPIAFIEPGPNLTQYLAAVGDRLGPAYRAVFFSTRVKSRSILARLGKTVDPPRRAGRARAWPDGVQIDVDGLVARLRKESDRALASQGGSTLNWLVVELARFLEQRAPAAVFLWNGSGLTAAIAEQLARARGIPVLFAENGYLPNTLQLDPEGVNAFASLGRGLDLDAMRAMRYAPDEQAAFTAMLDDYRAGRAPARTPPPGGRVRPSPLAYLLQAFQDWRERDPPIQANRRIPRSVPELPARYVFFPLQVRSDSQLTMHSPIYGNNLELAVRDLVAALAAIDPALRLVVKLHPADLGKSDYDPIARELPQVVWVGGGDVRGILRGAECVVTVNSTVGIEGLIFGKPVLTLGNNFYVRDGLVHPVRARDALAGRLELALNQPPDLALIEQYLRYLYLRAFVRAHWRDYSPQSLGNLADRIKAMVAARGAT